MSSELDFQSYINKQREKEKKRKEIYKLLLQSLIKLLNEKISLNESKLYYKLPLFSQTEESYNILDATEYIIRKLTENFNFKKIVTDIKIYDPNIIFIEWKIGNLTSKK